MSGLRAGCPLFIQNGVLQHNAGMMDDTDSPDSSVTQKRVNNKVDLYADQAHENNVKLVCVYVVVFVD